MKIKDLFRVGLAFTMVFLAFPGRSLSGSSENRLSLTFSGGAGYHFLGDIKNGLEGWNDLWHLKWRSILEGEFRPFHWGSEFGVELAARLKPNFSIGFETGILGASRESRRTVKYDDTYSRDVSDETLRLAVRAIPLIANGTLLLFPGKYLSVSAGIGLGVCLGSMDWRFSSVSKENGGSYEVNWTGHTLSPMVQLRAEIELKVREGFSIILETAGRFARLSGLRGRLDEDGESTEDAYFWYDTWAYHDMFFSPENMTATDKNVRKGVADLSGISLRMGLKVRLK